MLVEIYCKFNYEESFSDTDKIIPHLTFKQLNNLEKNLLKEFINQILIDGILWGRNKNSAKNSDLRSVSKIYNYQTFFSYNLRHYHLVNEDNRSETCGHIQDNNELSMNTCNTLVNYEIKNDRIIIYSISEHGKWDGLLDIIDPTHLSYSNCSICGVFSYNHGENCSCEITHQKYHILIKKKSNVIKIQQKEETLTYYNRKLNCMLKITQTKLINLTQNILIENITDLNKFL